MGSKRLPIPFVTACIVLGLLSAPQPLFAVSTEKVLYSFKGDSPPRADGASPEGSLLFDAPGNLYGATNSGGTYGFGTVFELMPGANGKWTKTVLHDFGENSGGFWPLGSLILDEGGNLYGTTAYGGDTYGSGCGGSGCGTVFELTPGANGKWIEKVLHSFGKGSDGQQPSGGLAVGPSGNLYGFTTEGGALGGGTAFQLTLEGDGRWTEKILYSFSGGVDWQAPSGTPVFDGAGNLYGATIYGNTAFRLARTANGEWTEEVLHTFGQGSDGSEPSGGLIFDVEGNLYGTTTEGGASNSGTVFKLTPKFGATNSWTETVLHSFNGKDGSEPVGLVIDGSGNLYGTTQWGGTFNSDCGNSYGCGTAFRLTPTGSTWTETVLHNFGKGSDGNTPLSGLIFDKAGNLYGATAGGGAINWGIVFQLMPDTNGKWTENMLHSFGHGTDGADGAGPSGVILDAKGNVYGTTSGGGNPAACGGHECGTVFTIDRDKSGKWIENQIHTFRGKDGADPLGNLIFDGRGNLYGTTAQGGAFYPCGAYDCSGTVFRLSPGRKGTWTETVLHSFGGGTDGQTPLGALVFDVSRNLYGTTLEGGSNYGLGTVYELTSEANDQWTERILYNFCAVQNCADGAYPNGGLVIDAAGNLYGTTSEGGAYGTGNVFQLRPVGHNQWIETVLYNFNGVVPIAPLIFDKAGNLYGVTSGDGPGNIFELTPHANGTWTENVLYGFTGGTDGGDPAGGLIFDGAGNLYGTTFLGGDLGCNQPSGCGVVFELTPSGNGRWTEAVLHAFSGKDGDVPEAPLVLDRAGHLRGATAGGGPLYNNNNGCCGTVFEIIP